MKHYALLTVYFIYFLSGITLKAQNTNYNYVLVHGAWHGAWTWYELEYLLLKAGNTVVNIDLPGHGIDTTNPGNVTLADYRNAIVNVLDQLNEPAILVGHSMGGIAISMAAEQRPEKISKLVYLAAFMLQNGQSMLQAALTDTASMILPALIVDTVNRVIDLNRSYIRDIFYGASTEKYTVLSEKLLRPEPLMPVVTPISISDNYYSVRRFYIETTDDNAITPQLQQRMYSALPCEEVYTLHSEHSPFFSTPENLKNYLQKIAKDDNPQKIKSAVEQTYKPLPTGALNIYPNPTNGTLNIANVLPSSKIFVWDVNGKLQYEINSDKGDVTVNLANKPSGQYLLKIISPGVTISKIITVQK